MLGGGGSGLKDSSTAAASTVGWDLLPGGGVDQHALDGHRRPEEAQASEAARVLDFMVRCSHVRPRLTAR